MKPSTPRLRPSAIRVFRFPNGTFHVGPVVYKQDYWLLTRRYRFSVCASPRSAKAAVTRWKNKLGINRVIGAELLEAVPNRDRKGADVETADARR